MKGNNGNFKSCLINPKEEAESQRRIEARKSQQAKEDVPRRVRIGGQAEKSDRTYQLRINTLGLERSR